MISRIILFASLLAISACGIPFWAVLGFPGPEYAPPTEEQLSQSPNIGERIEQAYWIKQSTNDIWYALWPYFESSDPLGSLAYMHYVMAFYSRTPASGLFKDSDLETRIFMQEKIQVSVYFYAISIGDPSSRIYQHFAGKPFPFDDPVSISLLQDVQGSALGSWDDIYPNFELQDLCDLSLFQIRHCYQTLSEVDLIFSFEELIDMEKDAIEAGFHPSGNLLDHVFRDQEVWEFWRTNS